MFGQRNLVITFLLLVVISSLAGCKRDSNEPQDSTRTPNPVEQVTEVPPTQPNDSPDLPVASPQPVVTVSVHTATPSSDSSNPISLDRVDPELLRISRCVAAGVSGGRGTAPAPTPTPGPGIQTGTSEADFARLLDYVPRAVEVGAQLLRWNSEFERRLELSGEIESEAGAIEELALRISLLCDFVAELDPPAQIRSLHDQLVDAILIRHAWISLAIENIKCCGTVKTDFFKEGMIDTATYAEQVVGQFDDQTSRTKDMVTVAIELLGAKTNSEPNWLASSNSSSYFLAGPSSIQASGIQGLGPKQWSRGTGILVRKFHVGRNLSLEQAKEMFSTLPDSRGEVLTSDAGVLGGNRVHRWELITIDDWNSKLFLFPLEADVVIIETGCPTGISDACSDLDSVISSIEFSVS